MNDRRRALPSVERLLQDPGIAPLLAEAPRRAVVDAVRESIAAVRIRRAPPPDHWEDEVRERLGRRLAPGLRPVLNATGIVLHTNLGRAPLAESAIRALVEIASGYSNLELDLHAGVRGNRTEHCRGLLCTVTGAADALVVNNAAGALVVALNAHAAGREVLISRGELIEIGGSFRIPDILERSGARLREVGTTNRTHLDDYRCALGSGVGAILTVHRSNFEQTGFVASPPPAALAELADQAAVPYLHDVGSGLLADLAPWGLTTEPSVPDAVSAGAGLVLFSGDKLLGGPQAGCLVGRPELVGACRSNPLARALRADKLTLAALAATLALYLDAERAVESIPVLRMLTIAPADLTDRAGRLAAACAPWCPVEIVAGESAVGGGSFPGAVLPTTLVALDPGEPGAAALALRLRVGEPAVLARVAHQRVLLDPRTLPEPAFAKLGRAVGAALHV